MTPLFSNKHPFFTAISLALGSAIALGLARFSYGLLLPVMREDLSWSYVVAGSMNTANAVGYLLGALSSPMLMRRVPAPLFFIGTSLLTAFLLWLSGSTFETEWLFLIRVLAGISSAWIFVAGGVLVARLGRMHPQDSGLLLGIYYAGPGLGIVLSSLIPYFLDHWQQDQAREHAWQLAWYALGFLAGVLALISYLPIRSIPAEQAQTTIQQPSRFITYSPMLAAYFMFGVGYIGYMTFVVALLAQLGFSGFILHLFYAILGLAVMASSRLWAKMLDRFKGGESLAILNTILGVACLLPAVLTVIQIELNALVTSLIFISGIVFGAVFLSAVASTTAFVKHNMPAQQWVGGITVFTSIFAVGQIIGPTVTGWISDGQGGLAQGLILSGCALLLGGLIALKQKPLIEK